MSKVLVEFKAKEGKYLVDFEKINGVYNHEKDGVIIASLDVDTYDIELSMTYEEAAEQLAIALGYYCTEMSGIVRIGSDHMLSKTEPDFTGIFIKNLPEEDTKTSSENN